MDENTKRLLLAKLDAHGKTFGGVNGGTHGHPDVGGVLGELKVVPAKNHGHGDGGFEHGELVADALASAGAKGNKCVVRGNLVGVEAVDELGVVTGPVLDARVGEGALETERVKDVGVLPALGRAMEVPDADENVHPLDEGHLDVAGTLGQGDILEATTNENRRLWVEAKRLGDAETHRLELLNVVVRRRSIVVAKDFVNVSLDSLHQFWLLDEAEQAPG